MSTVGQERRRFLKLGIIVSGGSLLAACTPPRTPTSETFPTPITDSLMKALQQTDAKLKAEQTEFAARQNTIARTSPAPNIPPSSDTPEPPNTLTPLSPSSTPESQNMTTPDYQRLNLEKIEKAQRGDVIELDRLRLVLWRTPWLGGDAYWARLLANYPGKIRLKQADCVYNEYKNHSELGDPTGKAEWQPEKPLKNAVVYVSLSQSKFVDPLLTFLQITYDDGTPEGETVTCDVETLEEDAKNAWNSWKAKFQTPSP